MSIILKDGGTTATTGGTDQTFSRTNTSVVNGYEYADVAQANFFAREKIIAVTRQPQLQNDGTYSKQKSSTRFTKPKTRADGSIAYNVARVELEFDPETTPTEVAELREFAAQMAKSSQFDTIHTVGALPA